MINAAKVAAKVVEQLKEDSGLTSLWPSLTVERSEYVNDDPNRTPWVGVYRVRKEYNPRTLGKHGKSWTGEATIRVMVQYGTLDSGEATEDVLEELLESVESALVKDLTFGGTMEIVNTLTVDYSYYIPDEDHNIYFQQATIDITGQVATG